MAMGNLSISLPNELEDWLKSLGISPSKYVQGKIREDMRNSRGYIDKMIALREEEIEKLKEVRRRLDQVPLTRFMEIDEPIPEDKNTEFYIRARARGESQAEVLALARSSRRIKAALDLEELDPVGWVRKNEQIYQRRLKAHGGIEGLRKALGIREVSKVRIQG